MDVRNPVQANGYPWIVETKLSVEHCQNYQFYSEEQTDRYRLRGFSRSAAGQARRRVGRQFNMSNGCLPRLVSFDN